MVNKMMVNKIIAELIIRGYSKATPNEDILVESTYTEKYPPCVSYTYEERANTLSALVRSNYESGGVKFWYYHNSFEEDPPILTLLTFSGGAGYLSWGYTRKDSNDIDRLNNDIDRLNKGVLEMPPGSFIQLGDNSNLVYVDDARIYLLACPGDKLRFEVWEYNVGLYTSGEIEGSGEWAKVVIAYGGQGGTAGIIKLYADSNNKNKIFLDGFNFAGVF